MTSASRLTPRDQLMPISVRGRAAGLTTGICMVLAGGALSWSALDSPGCTREVSVTACARATGIEGLIVMVGVALSIGGVVIVWRTSRRLVAPDGSSGWTWGEGLAVIAGGVVLSLLIPTYHCPAGYELIPVFQECRSSTQVPALILHPPTWLGWKLGIAAGSIGLGLVIARWRRLPWPLASAITVAVVGVATWFFADKAVGLPTIG